ncbi:amino acid transporter AVT3B-like [Melanaphis sacchari]|nr:amino acid transporter AVT3B-like [Melanaphis sacchari]
MIYADAVERGDGQLQPAAAADDREPRPFQIRGHLVHGIPQVGDSNYDPACPTCNPGSINDLGTPTTTVVVTTTSSAAEPDVATATAVSAADPIPVTVHYNGDEPLRENGTQDMQQHGGIVTYTDDYSANGFRTGIAVVFIAGEMAGIGMLAAPWAVVNLGWMGFILLITFGIATAYSASCLGTCWLILEERYAQYRVYPVPDPFSTIALHAVGKRTSYFTKACVHLTLFGSATVYLMLIAQSAQKLFAGTHPEVGFSTWLFVFSVALSSLMFLESPKDYCIVAIGALLTTMTSCYFVLMQILLDERIKEGSATETHKIACSANQFFLSFGSILFSYGGAASFPVIRSHTMFKRDEFSRNVVTSFIILAILFGSIVVGGYIVYGHTINPNILMSLGDSWLSYAAIILMAAHLILGFVIIVKPVSEQVESFFNTPHSFGFPRFIVRIGLLLAMIALGESMPNFTNLVALMGCSTVILATFVLPSIFYLRLCSMQCAIWPDRSLSWKSQVYMYMVIVVGLTSGTVAMLTALIELFDLESLINPFFVNLINSEENTYI